MSEPVTLPEKVDLIWNHTRVCGFNCDDCCVAAHHVKASQISTPDLSAYDPLVGLPGRSRYEVAQRMLQDRGSELTYDKKLRVLEHLSGLNARVDVSGGDALITPDGLPLLEACAAKIGRSNVTLADGTLLASPWAVNEHGRPLGDIWVLGNLADQPLTQLLATPKAQTFIRRAHENHGHCKVFAAIHSRRNDPLERIFDTSDPLNTTTAAIAPADRESGERDRQAVASPS